MTKKTLNHLAALGALLGLLMSAPLGMAQGKGRLPGRKWFIPPAAHASHGARGSQAASGSKDTPADGSQSYAFSFIDYPQSSGTYLEGINSGAASSKLELVGDNDNATAGFTLRVEGKGGLTYAFKPITHPENSDATGINDFGQIVGEYLNSAESYELSGTSLTTIAVPFAGTAWTQADDINNSGEVVGIYWDSTAAALYGFSLSGGVYTQLAYPGATATDTSGNNNLGEIAGFYVDSSSISHGLLISGGVYTSFDVPGAMGTFGSANNDSGDIVGWYCPTTACISGPGYNYNGFVYHQGTYTTLDVPGTPVTVLDGISDAGVVSGYYWDTNGLFHGFLASP